MKFKRLYIATLMGILAGVVCCKLSASGGTMPMKVLANIFVSRVLIGFVIGISAWKMPWAIHGVFMGLVVGLPTALGAMMGATAQYGKYEMFFITLVMGAIYGFVIELVTSGLFRVRQT